MDLNRFLIYVFAYFQLCVLYIREQIWKTAYVEDDDDGLAYCLFQYLQFFCAGRSLVVCASTFDIYFGAWLMRRFFSNVYEEEPLK